MKSMDMPPSLLEVQRAWRAGIAGGDFTAAVPLLIADAIAPTDRLEIYRNTAMSTLVNALRLAYPAVCKLVGEDFFAGAAHAFLAKDGAGTTWLDEYGAAFPEFLGTFAPLRAHRMLAAYLPDVAALERAVNHSLHAPDAPTLDLRTLASLPPEDVERLELEPNPSIGFLQADTPVDAIWNAVLTGDDDAMRAIDLDAGAVQLLVEWRIGNGGDRTGGIAGDDTDDCGSLHVERMADAEWCFARALCGGIPLRDALGESAARNPGFSANAALARHLAAGRFSGFRITS